MLPKPRTVFVAGATGYLGRELISALLARGHQVRALARAQSTEAVPRGAATIVGDALNAESFSEAIAPADTFVQLVGVAHPSPAKSREFETIDLASAQAAVHAASRAGVQHFVYVSVAHPAPVMKAYQAARRKAEQCLRESGLAASALRPWYVLGPGHRWPIVLLPLYWLAELLPWTRAGARRLGFVTLAQMTRALVSRVESEPSGFEVIGVPEIRRLASRLEETQ